MFFRKIVDVYNPDSVSVKLRRRRFQLLLKLLESFHRPVSILDVGGVEAFWDMACFPDDGQAEITLLNLEPQPLSRRDCRGLVGDARNLSIFADQSFNVVFSNSVIEHLALPADQRLMANEIRRVGQSFFVQTPNRWFPLEPHFLFPGFHFLPLGMRAALVRRFKLGWMPRAGSDEEARTMAASIRLLDRREFQDLFPEARIEVEVVLGLRKSFMAIKNPPAAR